MKSSAFQELAGVASYDCHISQDKTNTQLVVYRYCFS
jgi:hypothetical protein